MLDNTFVELAAGKTDGYIDFGHNFPSLLEGLDAEELSQTVL